MAPLHTSGRARAQELKGLGSNPGSAAARLRALAQHFTSLRTSLALVNGENIPLQRISLTGLVGEISELIFAQVPVR